ncbi:MAG: hypothetical protein WCW31_02865 [Patescibacteria group bacterium]|jgi:hypothetical protein
MSKTLTADQQAGIKKIMKDFHVEIDAVVDKHRKKINSILERASEEKLKKLRETIKSGR